MTFKTILAIAVGLVLLVGAYFLGQRLAPAPPPISPGLEKAFDELRKESAANRVALESLSRRITGQPIAGTQLRPEINVRVEAPPPPELNITVPPNAPPRVIAETKPVFCATKADCDRIYFSADQAITVRGAVRLGTVVPVCQIPLADGKCPSDKEANLPLRAEVPFTARVVRSELGVYNVLDEAYANATFKGVETATRVEVRVERSLPYNVGISGCVRTPNVVSAQAVYTNWLNNSKTALYQIEGGYGWPYGVVAGACVVVPLR